jgi:hypothetical protein
MKKISARACMCVEKSILECALNVVVGDKKAGNAIPQFITHGISSFYHRFPKQFSSFYA